jgi:biopolymer transport protein ExbB
MNAANIFVRSLAALMLASLTTAAVAATNLDDLLEQTRSAREKEAKANQEREAKFLAERNKQAALMTEARTALNEQKSRSSTLTTAFDTNEKKLAEMQTQLEARAGNLGEMFGVVRQVANDFSAVVNNSIISAQYPGRSEFVTKLAASKNLPSMQDLERFWFELQREMTETGKVVKYTGDVISATGGATTGNI